MGNTSMAEPLGIVIEHLEKKRRADKKARIELYKKLYEYAEAHNCVVLYELLGISEEFDEVYEKHE